MSRRKKTATETELASMVNRYRMSVEQARATPCSCGKNPDRTMGSLDQRELYWFASKTTAMSHTDSFRAAVKAARILRCANQVKNLKELQAANPVEDNAKVAQAHCRDCGQCFPISRRELDRASCRCQECGGMLEASGTMPVGECVKLCEASQISGKDIKTIRKALHYGEIVGRKNGRQWEIGLDSLVRWAEIDHELNSLRRQEGGDYLPSNRHACHRCNKVFRNLAALRLHIKEQHEDF